MPTLRALLESMRPRQWIKNLLVFAGALYAEQIEQIGPFLKVSAAFALFCALSGVVYLVNDIFDLESDRHHPLKCKRPIASGRLPVETARIAAIGIAFVALFLSFLVSRRFAICAVVYLALMLGYSLAFKRVVILDLLILAIGFVLRAYAGTQAVGVEVTPWFLSCILFLALFVAICKRRHELLMLNEKATDHRAVLREYSPGFLDQMVAASTAAALLSYALWTTAPETEKKFGGMFITVPFVVFGIFRYLYLVYHRSEGGAPELMFLTDRPLLLNIALWFVVVMILIYHPELVAWLPLVRSG